MAKFRSLMDDTKYLDVDGRILVVEPGEVVDLPDKWLAGKYMQVGECGEVAQWEAVDTTPKKAAKAADESDKENK